MAKFDLSLGTPLLGIIEKSLDVWLEIFRAMPEPKREQIAAQAADNLLFWQKFFDRIGDRLLDGGKEEP
jgi:hypothetical protein